MWEANLFLMLAGLSMDKVTWMLLDCLIFEVWVSGKDAHLGKMKTLLGKSYT